MKKIDISTPKYPNKFTIVDDEDFEKLNQWKWWYMNKRGKEYAISSQKTKYYMHRIITKAKKGEYVDHINGNGLDNRKKNLRICKNHQNLWNVGTRKTNTSGLKGIHLDKRIELKKRWCVVFNHNYKQIWVGRFATKKEAVVAYNKKIKEMRGDFAVLNKLW
jgi:hypothetical protein